MASGEPRFVGLPYDPDDETTQYDPDVVTTQYSAEPKMDDASAVERQLQPPPKQTSTVQMRNKKNTAFDTSFDMLFKTPDVRAFFSERIISHLAWATFIVCLITLLLLLVVLVAPGWGWTREIRGRVVSSSPSISSFCDYFYIYPSQGSNSRSVLPLQPAITRSHYGYI